MPASLYHVLTDKGSGDLFLLMGVLFMSMVTADIVTAFNICEKTGNFPFLNGH